MSRKEKEQLDKLLVEKGLADSIRKARSLIMAGRAIVDDHRIDKPGTLISKHSRIRIKKAESQYVSRGGTKLEHALDAFTIVIEGKTVLDVGVSTGGFTDCLLQLGASLVYAVDVGYGQLAWNLQQDKRVVNLERRNIRSISREEIQTPPEFAVIDVSFISVRKIWPHVISLLQPDGKILTLVKPQFEVSSNSIEKGGIIRDRRKYREVIKSLVETAHKLCMHVIGITESPILGRKGNREFFIFTQIDCRK